MTGSKLDIRKSNFLNKIKEVHGDKITLLSEYKDTKGKIKFKCNICETEDEVRADKLLEGRGCKNCSSWKFSKDTFVKILNDTYNDQYELISDFINMSTPIKLLHKPCGTILDIKSPTKFINKKENLCYICNCSRSKGEIETKRILDECHIEYEYQKKYKDLILKNHLSYDFYIPKYDLCIEFNGSQHYKPVEQFGAEKGFVNQILRDAIKQAYCEDNNINLLVIPFWEYRNIENILINKIKELKECC